MRILLAILTTVAGMAAPTAAYARAHPHHHHHAATVKTDRCHTG